MIAMCVSVSGGSRITRLFPDAIDHPVGTVKVAPPGVTRGVSAARRSGADLASPCACGAAWTAEYAANACTNAVTITTVNRAMRRMDICFTRFPRFGHLSIYRGVLGCKLQTGAKSLIRQTL